MSEPREEDRGRRRVSGCGLVLLLLVGLPLVSCGGLAAWWFGRNSMAQSQLDVRVQELRDAGMPVDDETMADYHRELTSDRYTKQWVFVLEALEAPASNRLSATLPVMGTGPDVPAPDEPWPEEAEVQRFLDHHRKTLELLHQIAQSDEPVYFPIDFDSFQTLLPYTQSTRKAAQVLSLEHALALRRGDDAAATRAVSDMIGTSLALRGEPIAVSQLVSIALHGMAIRALQQSIQQGGVPADQIDPLIERLMIFEDFEAPFRQALAGERALALAALSNPVLLDNTDEVPVWGSRPHGALAYLDSINQFHSIRGSDLDTFVSDAAEVQARLAADRDSASALQRLDTAVADVFLPATESYARAVAQQVMLNRLAILALGVRKFEYQTGRLPESLSDLTEVGLDPAQLMPLGGVPFGYRIEEGQAVLWGFAPVGGDTQVPANPPPLDTTLDGEQGENNKLWVWRLRPTSTAAADPPEGG